MSERKNVQTEHKWVGRLIDDPGKYSVVHSTTESIWAADLFDSPSDVPDDCTPVRVRVETWEEEGLPEKVTSWDWPSYAIRWAVAYTEDGSLVKNMEPFRNRSAAEQKAGQYVNWCVLPVHIPTETRRKVTLDPEPTETGCRCRGALETLVTAWEENRLSGWDWFDAKKALTDCDCKSEAKDE